MRRYIPAVGFLGFVFALICVVSVPTFGAGVLDQLKTRFNEDRGTLRPVVLVSPTCPECTSGAGWIQEYILKRNPKLDVNVYAVWYEMYPGDSPDDFSGAGTLLPDKRVVHYWDQPKDVGRWFYGLTPTNTKGDVEWDAFYFYGKDSVWTDKPTELLTWGRTILKDRRKLSAQVAQLTGTEPIPAEAPAPTAVPT